ncbi:PHD finger protein 7-like isoform X1 [Ctenocephalides felis]|uniref:PHD finger protein 7-like isoform X1 n=2 Tax=Ctenocephalides felis TaxID=7515 RepID=UPI000E6E4232|nr:PHD finger protein 7-like isoform X1 [Ctenocephalides felis]
MLIYKFLRMVKSKKQVYSTVTIGNEKMICDICRRSDVDETQLGQKCCYMNYKLHYFCLLLTQNTYQTAKPDTGIFGFTAKTIQAAYRRISQKICHYCGEKRANIKCYDEYCMIFYHLPCGILNECVTQYFETFNTYCPDHAPKQIVSNEDMLYSLANSRFEDCCGICYDTLIPEINYKTLWPPCCRNGFFHRKCILQFAFSAGESHFKCPLCNDKNVFVEEMRRIGVYVPKKDASWELEPEAFYDLYLRYDKCDAEPCLCPDGKNHRGREDSRSLHAALLIPTVFGVRILSHLKTT